MGRRGKWLSAIKKVFSHESKKKKDKKRKAKKKLSEKEKHEADLSTLPIEITPISPPPPSEEVKLTEVEDDERDNAYAIALATAAAAEAAAAAAQAAAVVVRLTTNSRNPAKSKEEMAAIKIQTAFRAYLARRALRALKGLIRLKTLIDGQSVKRQATTTLRCMQTLARLQSQIRARRVRMCEESQSIHKQFQQKHEKELEKSRASTGEDWDDSLQSKEQIEAKLLNKHEATIRRERTLAYAFSHQQVMKNSSKSGNPTFMDPNNPQWGWSWLERWMAARPWESQSLTDKEANNDQVSVKSTSKSVGEISTYVSSPEINSKKTSPLAQKANHISNSQPPSTPPSKATTSSPVTRKLRPASPRGSPRAGVMSARDEDSRSTGSIQSEKARRHSIAGSPARDDESLASSHVLPSYMASTASAKAKARLLSPLGVEKHETTPERGSVDLAKKRISFTGSPRAGQQRRHSGQPKVDNNPPMKDIVMNTEHQSLRMGGGSR